MKTFTLTECAVHARSKKEVYELLVVQGNVFLPPIQECDHVFIKEIITGKKHHIKGREAKVRQVPFSRSLSIEHIIDFAKLHCNIEDYMPKLNYKFPNRSWLCTIINTLIEKEFTIFIADKLEEREKKIVMMKKLSVSATKEFADLFRNSKLNSREITILNSLDLNGKFYQYLRNDRKRAYKQIEDDANNKDELIEFHKSANKALEVKLESMKEELEKLKQLHNDVME